MDPAVCMVSNQVENSNEISSLRAYTLPALFKTVP